MNNNPFPIKYKVLKPNHLINQLSKALRDTPHQYQIANTHQHPSIRKYHFRSPNIEQLLHIAEWRLNAVPQVAHCYFVRLSKAKLQLKTMECETFMEHMQVSAHQLSKLIIQECFYLMAQSAKGYKQLISKFKRVSVNSNTIGLNSNGQCIVWINRQLNSLAPEEQTVEDETHILCSIVNVVKERSERVCESLLLKMMEEVQRKQLKINGFIDYINSTASSMRISIPKDLKYLVNQHKIIRDVQNLRLKTQNGPIVKPKQLQTQRYRPMRTESRENGLISKQQNQICSEIRLFDTQKGGNSFEKKFVTQKMINTKKESYLSTNISSAKGCSDKKLQFRASSNDRKIFNFNFSKSRERTVISKCKSYEGQNQSIQIINAAKPLQRLNFCENQNKTKTTSVDKYKMDQSLKSNFSQRINSFRQQSRKVGNRKIYKSFVVELPKRNEYKNKSIGEECQEQESSPNKDKIRNQEDRVNGSMEEEGPLQNGEWQKAQECLKANQWIKNLDSHQLWVEQKLKTSINLGNEQNNYLQDIKLQKLQKLSRQMAASRLPNEDFYPLYSQTVIE